MAIRKILYVLAVALALLGASQLVLTRWWLDRIPGIVESDLFYLWGLPGVLFGVILLIGVLERAVGLRAFFAVVSVISIASGGLLLARPDLMRDMADALFLNRSSAVQVFDVWLSGLVRIGIGIALLYALIRPAGRQPEPEAEQPPEGTGELP